MNITKLIFVASVCWLLLTSTSLQAGNFKDSKISHVEYPGWFSTDPFNDLNQELNDARQAGKQGLMVVYGTEGCSYCAVFAEKNLGDPEISAMIKKNFNAVGMEIFDDASLVSPRGIETSVKDYAKQQGVMFSPTILFYDDKGRRIFRITGYQDIQRFKTSLDYVIGKHYQSQTIAEYVRSIRKSKASPASTASLRDDPLFSKPPYILQRNVIAASQPLLVIFEEAGCEECDSFHNKVLADKQVRTSLKDYEVIRLDSNDNKSGMITPDGTRTTPARWYQQQGFSRTPALLFFNEKGDTAIKTDNDMKEQRMMNSINYVNERAYEKGWSYQRFARTKAIERNLRKTAKLN